MLILTHVGSDIPEYAKWMWHQTRSYNPKHEIIMLANKHALKESKALRNEYDIQGFPVEELQSYPRLERFNELSWYKCWDKPNTVYPSPDNFVQGTSERIFVLNAFMDREGLTDILHCENDIMFYCDLDNIIDQSKETKGITLTPMSEIDVTCAVMFISNAEDLSIANDYTLDWLEEGNDAILAKIAEYNLNNPLCRPGIGYHNFMVHEMSILRLFAREPDSNINCYPILPSDRVPAISPNNEFNMIFDPGSYGPWLGGTNHKDASGRGHPPGYTEPDHYIGQALRRNEITITVENGITYVQDRETEAKFQLANLHIHTKDLRRFLHEPVQSI